MWRKLLSKKYRRNSQFRKNRKSNKNFSCYMKNRKSRKVHERLREVRKFGKNPKGNKNFSCYEKSLSNKYGKNSKNNKFNQILNLEREKVKKGFEKPANFAKIAKVTRICLAMWKDWATNGKNNISLSEHNILLPMAVSLHSSLIYTPLDYEIQQSNDPYWNTTWRAFPQCPVQLSQFWLDWGNRLQWRLL